METRDEHLAWCKQRALAYADAGNISDAVASMGSDLEKHPETAGHAGTKLGIGLLIAGLMTDREECRRWINGFR